MTQTGRRFTQRKVLTSEAHFFGQTAHFRPSEPFGELWYTCLMLTKQVKTFVATQVREEVRRELARARLGAIPLISTREQKEIETKYGKPSRRAARSFKVSL